MFKLGYRVGLCVPVFLLLFCLYGFIVPYGDSDSDVVVRRLDLSCPLVSFHCSQSDVSSVMLFHSRFPFIVGDDAVYLAYLQGEYLCSENLSEFCSLIGYSND